MRDFAERYGPWAVVAGASEGLGASFAACLAERGIHLVLLARRKPLLEALAAELRDAHGVRVRCVALDLGGDDWADTLRAATAEVDVGLLIYNAAAVPVGRFLEVDGDALEEAVRVNALGPVRFVHALLPSLHRRGRGGVVLMSSLSGLQGVPRVATYAATRAFNSILAEGLWHELRDAGIDVIGCCAGAIPTPGYRRATDRDAPGMLASEVVANRTLDALGHGPEVVPGTLNRLVAQVFRRLLPRRTAVRLMAANTADLG